MPPPCCARCGAPAALRRPRSGQPLCRACFMGAFEAEMLRAVAAGRPALPPGAAVAVAASGGKDSSVLSHVLRRLNGRLRLRLLLLSVDEGIGGYRDVALGAVRRHRGALPLVLVSHEGLYGWPMDRVAAGLRRGGGHCTVCGVLRRRALERAARALGCTALATGHNADDIAETVLMNFLRGDVARLRRTASEATAEATAEATSEATAEATNEATTEAAAPTGTPETATEMDPGAARATMKATAGASRSSSRATMEMSNEATGTPMEPTRTPNEATKSPREPGSPMVPTTTPNDANGIPSEAIGTSTEATRSHTEATGSSRETGSPTEATRSPTEAKRSYTEPTGTPVEPTGTPSEASGIPSEATGTSTEATRSHMEATRSSRETGSPTEATGIPMEPTGKCTEPTGTPSEASGPPPEASVRRARAGGPSAAPWPAVPRCKPLRHAYEKEIVLYARFAGLDYASAECVYAPHAHRGHARALLKELEAARASAVAALGHSGRALAVRGDVAAKALRACGRCGFAASQPLCKACGLLASLERGLPRLALGKREPAVATWVWGTGGHNGHGAGDHEAGGHGDGSHDGHGLGDHGLGSHDFSDHEVGDHEVSGHGGCCRAVGDHGASGLQVDGQQVGGHGDGGHGGHGVGGRGDTARGGCGGGGHRGCCGGAGGHGAWPGGPSGPGPRDQGAGQEVEVEVVVGKGGRGQRRRVRGLGRVRGALNVWDF